MKKIRLFVLCTFLLVSGCMKVSAEEEMLQYIEEKYDEEFEVISKETQVRTL